MAISKQGLVEEALNSITDVHGIPQTAVAFGGGGKGQTAYVEGHRGIAVIEGKGDSRLAAVRALQAELWKIDFAQSAADDGEELECNSSECMASKSSICSCKCEGRNHGAMSGERAKSAWAVTPITPKACACGCGQTTARRYVPGHDARHHVALAAKAAGLTVEAYRASLKASSNKRAAEKRADKRAALKAGAAKIEAAAKAGTLVPGSKPRRRAELKALTAINKVAAGLGVSPKGDDLPF